MNVSRMFGRPRSDKAREAVLAAAFELLVARGYAGLSIEAVAAHAGVAKTTIYRWWRAKAELAIDAFLHATEAELRLPETDRAEADFRTQIEALAELLHGKRGRALAGMLAGSVTDASLALALNERLLRSRREWGLRRMARARAAGELRAGVDDEAALAVLYGPVFAPLLFGEDIPTAAGVRAFLDVACAGIFREEVSQENPAPQPREGRQPPLDPA